VDERKRRRGLCSCSNERIQEDGVFVAFFSFLSLIYSTNGMFYLGFFFSA
jgi:hypothetical protein